MTINRIAAIWCRVSTHGQGELSLDSQEDADRRALTAQGYGCPPQYVLKVDWTSLDLMSCPQFQQLRRWIADGEVKAVGTLDRDRLQAQGLQRLTRGRHDHGEDGVHPTASLNADLGIGLANLPFLMPE